MQENTEYGESDIIYGFQSPCSLTHARTKNAVFFVFFYIFVRACGGGEASQICKVAGSECASLSGGAVVTVSHSTYSDSESVASASASEHESIATLAVF